MESAAHPYTSFTHAHLTSTFQLLSGDKPSTVSQGVVCLFPPGSCLQFLSRTCREFSSNQISHCCGSSIFFFHRVYCVANSRSPRAFRKPICVHEKILCTSHAYRWVTQRWYLPPYLPGQTQRLITYPSGAREGGRRGLLALCCRSSVFECRAPLPRVGTDFPISNTAKDENVIHITTSTSVRETACRKILVLNYIYPKSVTYLSQNCEKEPPPPSPSPRRLALGARNVCLVGENPTCSVPALWVREGLIARVLRTTPPCMVRSLPLPARPSPAAIRPCHEGVIV